MKHTNDYCVEKVETVERLNLKVDDLRLTAMAALEELDQILTKNEAVARSAGWSLTAIRGHLDSMVDTLRTKI
jgi:hypothetical protein